MSVQFVIQRVVLTLIIITFLVIAVVYHYYYQYQLQHLVEERIDQREFVIIPKRSRQFVSGINSMIASLGMHCEKMLYTKHNEMQLRSYWELVNSYKSFHREGVRKLHSGNSSDVRTLTWHCDSSYRCGGLGYRIIGIMASLLFAMFSNRVLLLRWDKTSVENTYLLPNMINWKYPNHSLYGSFIDLGSFHEITGTMRKYENKMIESLVGNTTHIQLLYNHNHAIDEIIAKLNSKCKGKERQTLHLSNSTNLHLFESVSFMYLFRINEELKSFANEVRGKLNIHGKRYVALHLRTGNFNSNLTEHPNARSFARSLHSLRKATNCAIKQADEHIGPDGVVVLVSDSVSTKQRLAKMYSRVKILDNVPVHVDKSAKLDNDEMLGTWEDLIIMAEAHIIVYHHSSFPMLAMAMCGVPGNRLVDFIKQC